MRKVRDFSQEKIGKLQPLYIDETKPRGAGHNIYWICQCDCGNLISVNSCNLQSGIRNNRVMSCGCHTPLKNLIGQKFGKLTVIALDNDYKSSKENGWKHKWICQCECGNKISVFGSNLTRLHTTSCGCINSSIGVTNIENLLKANNIEYKKEYSFEDLKHKKKLRFDFAIFKDGQLIKLIEFDGRQHFYDDFNWNSNERLEDRQERDKIKNEYCIKNNINLIRVPYTKRDNVTLQDLKL